MLRGGEMNEYSVLLWSVLGSIAVQLFIMYQWMQTPKPQRPPIDRIYIMSLFIPPIIASIFAMVHYKSGVNLTPLITFHIGVSSPTIFKTGSEVVLSTRKPKVS